MQNVMTEFSKVKIVFALALLGTLFALRPIITTFGNVSYQLFSLPLKLNYVYWIFAVLLGTSVYFYAIALIGENIFFDYLKKIGNFTYAMALIIPPLYVLLYAVSVITVFFMDLLKHPLTARILETLFSVLAGAIAAVGIQLFFKSFAKRDRSEKVQNFSEQENALLSRAKKLFNENYFDISVTESWKAIEVALRKAFFNLGMNVKSTSGLSIITLSTKKKVISEQQAEDLMYVRKLRNNAAHTEIKIDREDAQRAINISDKIIASLDKITETCYYCNSEYPIFSLESDDITGAFICKSCLEKHPEWKEELIAMGMDP